MRSQRIVWAAITACVAIAACQKYTDTPGVDDPRLHNRFYCNTPDAVNYNWDFPGTPDSTKCVFPSDVFKGHYYYVDSIYNADGSSLLKQDTLQFDIQALNRTHISLTGFCGSGNGATIALTATRTFRAQVDTVAAIVKGQLLCRPLDTLSGYFIASQDSTSGILARRLKFSFTVLSDTGSTEHRGTAIKQ